MGVENSSIRGRGKSELYQSVGDEKELLPYRLGCPYTFFFWKIVLACWAGRVIRHFVEACLGWGAFGFLPKLW
jgi:hypothetical protein